MIEAVSVSPRAQSCLSVRSTGGGGTLPSLSLLLTCSGVYTYIASATDLPRDFG